MKVYDTLYDWQKQFVDNTPREYFIKLFGEERVRKALEDNFDNPVAGTSHIERLGLFLRMGTGKTKITVAKAEKKNADCIFVTSLRSKVVAGEEEGEFGWELKLAGYEVFYSHKAFNSDGEFTILGLDSKKQFARFEEVVEAGGKIAYVFNHEHITTKKGYQRLVYLASQYKNISWIIDEAHKISNHKADVADRVYKMLYDWNTPEIKVSLRDLKKQIKQAELENDLVLLKQLNNLHMLSKENVFKKNITLFALATGSPNSSGYRSFYHILRLLGHRWECMAKIYSEETDLVEVKQLRDYKAFFHEYCIEDTYAKRFNPFAQAIKSYKNTDKLLDIVQQYAFFAKTENYFQGMPKRLVEVQWIPKDESYTKMNDPRKDNPYYRVLDGFICDTPALLGMRSRQLATGFMGNAEHCEYYHVNKVEALREKLEAEPGNYIIFYNFTPELYMILSAAEELGYNIDIYNGMEKNMDNYRKAKGSEDEKNLLIMNVASGSAALNLQKYSNMIFFAIPDMFRDYDQAIGRIQRIGQKEKEVSVLVLITKGTVEERVWKQIKQGLNYTNAMYERDIIWREI